MSKDKSLDELAEESVETLQIELPAGLYTEVAEKVAEAVRTSYYNHVGVIIAEKVTEKLNEEGFCERVADAVVERVKLDEDEYINGVTDRIKEHLLDTIGVIASETQEKIQEKVKSYGFIKIADRR